VILAFSGDGAVTGWMRVAKPRLTFSGKSHQAAPIFTHPLHHPANATLFPAKSAQEPIESPVFL